MIENLFVSLPQIKNWNLFINILKFTIMSDKKFEQTELDEEQLDVVSGGTSHPNLGDNVSAGRTTIF
ncbi:hypothetical protein SAMN05216463_10771 [Xylanibacter ruminicola]|uniref:Uncharacterized protein n=1 Tax=Xylanibacter ruminicola TaxID=839 RepID=A0A1M6TXI2_XYLRU|nr:hypothetical protein SAMN05216463_10771 [Xylanibacter ruminicola]